MSAESSYARSTCRWARLFAALLILVACGQAQEATTTEAPTTTTVSSTTETTSSGLSTSTSAATPTTEAVGPLETTNFEVPFSLTAPTAAFVLSQEVEDGVVLFSGGPGRWLVFTTAGQPEIEGWVEFLTTDPKLIATEPVDAQIGSATGVTVDVRTSAEAIDGAACRVEVPCVQLFLFAPAPESLFGWIVEEGLVDRVWLVDEEGETVAIIAEATDEGFDTWIVEVEEALATLEWA